ncbi:CpsD/CapB family tyrosine-protein kinase [Anaerococcus ihuae]|uniref:CpsD/CapB family tyrosine-protein kinase n=1 Tax=Anaerococcus ihuae TaxID=2899519 RepID=UPI001F223CC9|nr:CpsD/CapB family tyrosine-protein kinase [Anaerococcus ihuae]
MKEKNEYLSNSSFYDESIYSIKTNLKYNKEYKNYKIIGMTSSKPNEKNTKALYDIAKSFASDGLKVVLLDFDLRMPKLDNLLKLDKNIGLTDFFYDNNNINEILIKDKNQENLSILLSGQKPNNPTEILDSSKVKNIIKDLSEKFDYIFINVPPVDLLADGAIVSTYCDGIILSFKYNDTKKEELDKAVENLKKVNANIIGMIMTHAKIDKNIYKGYFNK